MLSVQQLNFSFSSLSPLHFIAGLAVCFCVWMQACVSWILTGYLLNATCVEFEKNCYNFINIDVLRDYLCMKGPWGSKPLCNLSVSLSGCLFGTAHFSSYFPSSSSLRSKG